MMRASAPGKCILFGEHAVVYGQPAVAVAIEQRCSVEIVDSEDENWYLDGMKFKAKKHPHILMVFEVGTASMMAAKGAIKPIYEVMT